MDPGQYVSAFSNFRMKSSKAGECVPAAPARSPTVGSAASATTPADPTLTDVTMPEPAAERGLAIDAASVVSATTPRTPATSAITSAAVLASPAVLLLSRLRATVSTVVVFPPVRPRTASDQSDFGARDRLHVRTPRLFAFPFSRAPGRRLWLCPRRRREIFITSGGVTLKNSQFHFLWRSCIKPEIGEHRKILRYVYTFTRTIFAFKVNSTILGLLVAGRHPHNNAGKAACNSFRRKAEPRASQEHSEVRTRCPPPLDACPCLRATGWSRGTP